MDIGNCMNLSTLSVSPGKTWDWGSFGLVISGMLILMLACPFVRNVAEIEHVGVVTMSGHGPCLVFP